MISHNVENVNSPMSPSFRVHLANFLAEHGIINVGLVVRGETFEMFLSRFNDLLNTWTPEEREKVQLDYMYPYVVEEDDDEPDQLISYEDVFNFGDMNNG